jgi:peptidase M23-like protein
MSGRAGCPVCAGTVDVFSQHVVVDGSTVKIFCSPECMAGKRLAGAPAMALPEPRAAARLRPFVAGGAFLGILFVAETTSPEPVPPPLPVPAQAVVTVPAPLPLPPPVQPEWVKDVLRDVWLHPLAGPMRRMPSLDGAVFGAERPGERPPECKNGHCGVDIGGDVWGEPVLAVHDGVVDRVQRGPNEEHGGLYVRLAHRNGTVFTQYFHLAAIPRWLHVGKPVEAGEIIGLVGDSGVKESGPHLHFTISVRPGPDQPEQFIDPEPLIALWPLHLTAHGTDGRAVSTRVAVGRVHGAAPHRRRAPAPEPATAEAETQ